MKQLIPYLNFNGTCRQAMHFYQTCLGGELDIQTISESPIATQCSPGIQENIMHSTLTKGEFQLMASDMPSPGGYSYGTNFSLNINCSSEEEINNLFQKLSADGKVFVPVRREFWGALFGAIEDKFGIRWQFHFNKN